MKEFIESLCRYVAPSGSERPLQEALLEHVREAADEAWVDTLGNGIATKQGTGPHVLLAAHADEAGVMVVDIDENGFLRLIAVGDVSPLRLVGRHVTLTTGVTGVVGVEAKVNEADLGFEHLYLDIGAGSLAEAKEKARIGDTGVVAEPLVALGEKRLAGRALDNRVGCAIAIKAFLQLAAAGRHVTVAFTAQQVVGARGAHTVAFRTMPEYALVIDAVPAGDMPDAKRMAVTLGDGPAIKVMDGTAIVPLAVKDHLTAAAAQLGLSPQFEVWPRSLTDAGALQLTRAGTLVGGISYPARYVGGPSTVIDLDDVDKTLQLVVQAAQSLPTINA